MSSRKSESIRITKLGKRKLAALATRADRFGMTPQKYVIHLIEMDIAISEQAKTFTFEQLAGPPVHADEEKIDRLVKDAKRRLYKSVSRRGSAK